MEEAEGVAPAFGEERPEENGAARENDGGGAFGEDRRGRGRNRREGERAKACAEESECFRRALGQDDSRADHGDGEHAAEGHVGGGGVREADHANGGREQKQQPASGFSAVETQCEPC